jgi:peptidoglycan lytic transglycosylase G
LSEPTRRSVEPDLITPQREMGTLPRNRLGVTERNGNGYRRKRRAGMSGRGIVVLLVAVLAVIFAVFVLLPTFGGGLLRSMAEDNPDLIRLPLFADAVRDQLGDRPDTPGGTDPTPVDFNIVSGTGSREITEQLVDRGIVTDRLAFTYVLINDGLANKLQAGTHVLNRTMTPREVAENLAAAPAPSAQTVSLALRNGLRIEQIAAYLQLNADQIAFDPADFLALARNPPADLLAEYSMLATKPEGKSLEGYLGSGVIQIPKDTDARGLLEILLARRQAELEPLLSSPIPDNLNSFYDVLTLASIVEREAKLDADRPMIAGVYVNRLAGLANGVRLLNSEPTVVYANDTMKLREMPLITWPTYVFWGLTGFADLGDVEVADDLASFQTWHSTGLPDWPIASPSLASINAALSPDTADGYIFFYAKCDGSGGHWFEKTLEEHQQHVIDCADGSTGDPSETAPAGSPTEIPAETVSP